MASVSITSQKPASRILMVETMAGIRHRAGQRDAGPPTHHAGSARYQNMLAHLRLLSLYLS